MNTERVGGDDVEFEVNQFADMTPEEFKHRVLMQEMTPPVLYHF
jgi:hypothetical protein